MRYKTILTLSAALVAAGATHAQTIRDADTSHGIYWSSTDTTVAGFMVLVRPHLSEETVATVAVMNKAARHIACTNIFAGLGYGVYEVSLVSVTTNRTASFESARTTLNWMVGPRPATPGFVTLRVLPTTTTRTIPAAPVAEETVTLEQLGIIPSAPVRQDRPTQLSPRAAAQRGTQKQ
jgi:hypothetical protein